MNYLKHIWQSPLIFATGLAALVHSTWALGTMFSGEQPAIETITTGIGYVHFAGWLIPALLIAFALDIGQIITSHEIRTMGMTKARAITFVVFALATYYLQWLYMAHHMPLVELAEGISSIHRDAALWLRNMGLWLIPSLLPLSTLLYTFSTENDDHAVQVSAPEFQVSKPEIDDEIEPLPAIETPDLNLLEAEIAKNDEILPFRELEQDTQEPLEQLAQVHNQHIRMLNNGLHVATCYCGWQSSEKDTAESAHRALMTHKTHHCPIQHQNGVTHHAND